MELTGDLVIGATRAQVWAALNDPEILAACIPGCEGVEVVSPTEKTARVAVKVGPVRARFSGCIRMDDVVEAERCAMSFEGSGGAAGMARGQSQVELTDEGLHTRLRYTVQASVAGKLGQVGGRMIDAAAKQMADQFFAAFKARIAPAVEDDPATDEDSAAPSPSRSEPDPTASAQPGAMPEQAHQSARRPVDQIVPPGAADEWLRVKWFVLGSLATGLGIWIGARL
jgi:carbon monoxide dehydrogenase subunit G